MEQNTYQTVRNTIDVSKYLKKIKIDSFKLRVPSQKIKIVSSTFREKFQKLYITGEIDSNINLENHKTDISQGITSRMGYAISRHGNEETEVFYFQLNAKMCKEEYFSGITLETIKIVYDYVMSLNIVFVAYEDFLCGYVSDIDFAYDFNISPKVLIALNQKIFDNVIESKKRYMDKPFKKIDNVGLAFNKREKATPSLPFIKTYHKGLELKNNSKEFYNAYLSSLQVENIGRLEYTLKNSKHQKYLGIEIKTLHQLLNTDENLITDIVLSGIKENYLDKGLKTMNYSNFTPTEKVMLFYIEALISKGFDKQALYNSLSVFDIKDPKQRVDKSKMNKLISRLIEESVKKEELDKNKILNDVIRLLNLDILI